MNDWSSNRAQGVETPVGVGVGSAIVGMGFANSIPILFRAASATDPTGRGRGLALVTSVGYTGFLIGLPLAMLLVVAGSMVLASGALCLRIRGRGRNH